MSTWLTKNLPHLTSLSADARSRLDVAAPPVGFSVTSARSGHVLIECDGRALDSRRDPVAAARSAAVAVAASPVVVIGFGAGYFVEALLERGIDVAGLVETADALAAALAARDLRAVLDRVPVAIVDGPGAGTAVAILRARADRVAAHVPRVQMHDGLASLARAWERLAAARAPRVVVAGPPSGGSLGVARSVAAAARSAGAHVQFVDASAFGGAHEAFGALPLPRPRQLALQGHFTLLMGEAIVEVARSWPADLVLALAQAPLSEPALSRLRDSGIQTAFWFVENTRVLTYWRDVARHYDRFYAIQPGSVLDTVASAGAAAVAYLPMGCDPAQHFPVELTVNDRTRFGAPVAFAGAPYLNRRHLLAAVRDFGLRVWGDGWEATALAPCLGHRGRFDTETLRKVIAATTVNLNIHSAEHVTGLDPQPDYVNPRAFEIAACGGFQLVDRRDPLPALFRDDEVATFESAAQMREQVAFFLANPEQASAMAARARTRVLASHTYGERVRRILEDALPPHLQGGPAADGTHSIDDAIAAAAGRPVLDADEALMRLVAAVGKETAAR